MDITKAGAAVTAQPAEAELAAIRTFARSELAPEDVYCFSVLLCDNEVDRDFERFTEATLSELRELFVGKTGIADHDWSSERQKARIYRTELITDPERRTSLGAPYMYLKGWAYMLRTEGNAELIAEIEGGIKRETSVGCAVAKTVCSVCGEELGKGKCTHVKGREYAGVLCVGELTGAVDAYEWSFVAVPAQKSAGVLKRRAAETGTAELKDLRRRAALGDRYLEELRAEVLRLSLLCGRDLHAAMEKSVGRMEAPELLEFRESLRARAAEKLPLQCQLPGRDEITDFAGEAYKV